MREGFKRFISLVMAFVFMVPNVVLASENNYVYVPEIEIEDEVKEGNLFYLASSEITMDENSGDHYLVKIGRGGDISQEASVAVKLSDITAKYGKDYRVYLYDGGLFNEADKDKDAFSVVEMIEGQEYTEFEVSDPEELINDIEDGVVSEGAIAVEIGKGLNEAIVANKEEKGEDSADYVEAAENVVLLEAEAFDNSQKTTEAEEVTDATTEEAAASNDLSTLAGAKEAFTGIESDRVKPKASMDIIDQFEELQAYQDLADTISDSMTGAVLNVDFESNEAEKYIEIVPIDNDESDSTRIFNITIGDPEGEYTVSAYSTAVAKITDDEEKVSAKVSLAAAMITPDTDTDYARITIKREGGLNDLVSVMLKSKSNTAMSGRDFSPVSAEVVFPFGVTERTVDIPVNTDYITEEAVFGVYIDTPVGCEIEGNSETLVYLYPSVKDEEGESNGISDRGLDEDYAIETYMNDSGYNRNQRVYFPRVYTNNSSTRCIEKSSNFKDNCQGEGDYGWYIRPTDDRKWARAEFSPDNNGITAHYDVNGLTFSYRGKFAAYPRDGTARAGFRITGYDANGNVTNSTCWNDWQFTGKWENWHEVTIYTNQGNVRGVQVYAEDDNGSGRDIQAHFADLYPIKRQFKITLAAADKMYLRTVDGNGTKLTEVQPSAYISNKMSKSLGIDAADTNTLAYRTSGESLSITVGNNEYFRLKGLYAVNSQNPKEMIKIADANGNNTCTFTLDNALLTKLIHRGKGDSWDYVTLSDRSSGGKYGNITIKPVFEYIDKKVYVEKNTQYENNLSIDAYNALGYVSVNGKEYKLDDNTFNLEIKPNDSLGTTFHYGDELVVKTNATLPDFARAAGVGYRIGTNIDTMDKTRRDLRNAEAQYSFTRSNSKDILKQNVVTFYPIYTEKENGLTLMVRKSDIDNGIIDTSYGIISKFTDSNVQKLLEKRTENGKEVEYYRFVASTDVKTDTYYQYSARAKDGYAIKWVDDITKTVYSGDNMLYKPMGLSQEDNVLIVSAENQNVVNLRFNGTVNYNVYDISSGTVGAYTMPLRNAVVTMGGVGAVTDDNGKFETTDVGRYIDGTHIIKRVGFDNDFNYFDYVINTSNKKNVTSKEETFTNYYVETVSEVKTVQDGTKKVRKLVCRLLNLFGIKKVVISGDINEPYDEDDKGTLINCRYRTDEIPVYKTEVITETVTKSITKTDTVYTINLGNNNVQATNDATGIVDVNVYEGDSTYPESGVIDINDSNYTFRADVRETSDEHIKELKFVIVDSVTKKTKYEIPAQYESSSGQWVAVEKMNIAMTGSYTKGDTLYAVVSTDKNVSGASGSLLEYLPVYTGYDFIQGDSAYDTYEPQNFNLPTNGNFVSLPVLDTLATGFNFPFVSIALEKRPTGEYRVKMGVNVSDIVDSAAGTSLNKKEDDAGMGYTTGIDWLHHPIEGLKSRASFAYDSIFKKGLQETPLLNGATSRLGPTQFKVAIIVGGYIDFGKVETTMNGVTYSDFAVTGGGGYIGVTLTFKKNFYFLICGTVPAYIGGSASGTLIGNMGATRKSNTIVSLSSMKDQQLDIDDALAFNGNLNASMSVCLYAGVGLCDVLGVRLEGDVDLGLLWEPLAKQTYAMNDEEDEIINNDYSNAKIHEVGFTAVFSLGGKVDLLLFTIPLMYKFDPIHSGFNKDIQNAHVRKTSSSTVDVDGTTIPTDITGHVADGWYYIRNIHNNQYLAVNEGNAVFSSMTAGDDSALRFYISTENKSVTIKPYDGYTDENAKYLMIAEEDGKNKLKVSESIAEDSINAYYKFLLREPNIGDFNIISAAYGGEAYLMLDGNTPIFGLTGTDNDQLWRLEPVDEPVTNGIYTIKNNGLNKYLTDVNGKAQLADEADDNSQKWNVSVSGDYITLQNAETKNYLYVDSDSSGNGISISVKDKDDSNAVFFDTTKLIDGSYYITTGYSLGTKYLSVYGDGKDVVTNQSNDTYNQIWTFEKAEDIVNGGSSGTQKTALLNSEGVSLFTSDDETITAIEYSDENDYSDENVYLRQRTTGDSTWTASNGNRRYLDSDTAIDETGLYSGFITSNETTLVENSYERPDSQVVNLGNGDYMLVFIDTDSSRGDLERNVLKYAFYRDGQWSQPYVIQDDGTADFQPSVADAGDNVAISWISSDISVEKTGDPTQYLTTMEIYNTLINKSTGEVGEITRLTNDTYYDYSPTVVYDSTTGDMAVYYIKSAVGSSFLDTGNSFTNDCIITYMLYDNSMGKWLTDYYYPEEVSDEDTAQDLIENWGGQRFLPSPIDELNMKDPLITDFTAIGYNGLAVYGYTIDKDNDSSTNEDRDLFIQVYDFTTHKNHPPIRITQDGVDDDGTITSEVADTMPQFVRAGGENGSTYLYWFRGDHKLSYIDVSDMAHNGLNNDGTISSDYDLAPADVIINLPPEMKKGSNEAYATMSYYKVCVDKDDNIYVIWVDLDRETNKQEIFATAVITDEETGVTSYADAYQLTHSGKHNDEPAFLVDDEGNMIVVATRYNTVETDDPINPLDIRDLELVATVFEPYGELYAEDITLSDLTPNVGESVNAEFRIYNRGLTVAKGYTVSYCEMKDGQKLRTLDTIHSDDYIKAGDFVELNYDWLVPEDMDGISLGIEVTEEFMNNSSLAESDKLSASPDINIDGVSISQKDDGFYIYLVATNNGNVATDDSDNINVVYYPEKAPANMLGIEDEQFAKSPMGEIQPGEVKEIEIPIDNINGEMFNAYGYLPVFVAVTNSDDDIISNDIIDYIIMENPIDISVNNLEQIVIDAGEAIDLSMTYGPAERFNDVVPYYYTEDTGTATVIDNQLVGVSAGSTILVAKAEPYGSSKEIEVVVNEVSTTEPTTETTTQAQGSHSGGSGGGSVNRAATTTEAQTEETTEAATDVTTDDTETKDAFIDISDHWGRDVINEIAKKNIVEGYEDNSFKPNNSITRAEFLTILYKSGLVDTTVSDEDISFKDVSGNEWYYDYIKWGAINNIIVGYDDNTFRGNNIITREEMAVVISKFVELSDIELNKGEAIKFADEADIAPWAKEYVDNISAYGIVRGDNNNCYMPNKDLTRVETAVIINELTK